MCLVQTECDCIKLKVHFHGLKIIGGKKKNKKKKAHSLQLWDPLMYL